MKLKYKYLFIASGIIVGAISGFFYWKYIGCENGCSIKSVWWRMTLWGAVMGGLLISLIVDVFQKKLRN